VDLARIFNYLPLRSQRTNLCDPSLLGKLLPVQHQNNPIQAAGCHAAASIISTSSGLCCAASDQLSPVSALKLAMACIK